MYEKYCNNEPKLAYLVKISVQSYVFIVAFHNVKGRFPRAVYKFVIILQHLFI